MPQSVRLGLIGAGRWGQVYLRTISELGNRCRLTHLGTSKPENAALVPYPVHVEADWRRVVASDCDAVIIATPTPTHAQIAEACLEARKPCLVEKPLCLDVATAERLQAKIAATGSLVLVGHTPLFHPVYQALKRRLKETCEPVRAIVAQRLGSDQPLSAMPVVWEWGPHDVSLCLDLLERSPRHVEALAGPLGPSGSPALVMLRLEFTGGACAWIHTGWLAAQRQRVLSVLTDQLCYVFDDLAVEKLTASSLVAGGEGLPLWSARRALAVGDERPVLAVLMTYFLDGLAGGDRRYFGGALALEVTRVLADCDRALSAWELAR